MNLKRTLPLAVALFALARAAFAADNEAGVPLTPAGKALADVWDPTKDESAGELCRAYAGPAIMRVPGRFHITWQDDNTLKIETDAGTQTRLLHFGDNRREPHGLAIPVDEREHVAPGFRDAHRAAGR